MSVALPGTFRSESARALPLGECSGSAAEAVLTTVRRATAAARSSVVFISFIFLLCAALRRFVHVLGYAARRGIPHEILGNRARGDRPWDCRTWSKKAGR